MQQDFWQQRWQLNQIGFHALTFNSHLLQYWPGLSLPSGSRVLVPLCGKSLDMLWLRAQNHQVIGVELSTLAIDAFFAENVLSHTRHLVGNFMLSETDGLRIFCGDFFALQRGDLKVVDAVYDRAALVALPPDMRREYALKLKSLLQSGAKILLVSFDYQQTEMDGPPFCVAGDEIHELFAGWCEIEFLADGDMLEKEPHFRQRGLSRMQEQVYRLTVR